MIENVNQARDIFEAQLKEATDAKLETEEKLKSQILQYQKSNERETQLKIEFDELAE